MTSMTSELEDVIERLEIERCNCKFQLEAATDLILRLYDELTEDQYATDEDYMLGLIETYLEESV